MVLLHWYWDINSKLIKYCLTEVQTCVFITACFFQLLEWHLIAYMAKFQGQRHVNLLDVEKEIFNRYEHSTSNYIKLSIGMMVFYHALKIIIAIKYLNCIDENDDCTYTQNVAYYVLLSIDVLVGVCWITYMVEVLLQLYW